MVQTGVQHWRRPPGIFRRTEYDDGIAGPRLVGRGYRAYLVVQPSAPHNRDQKHKGKQPPNKHPHSGLPPPHLHGLSRRVSVCDIPLVSAPTSMTPEEPLRPVAGITTGYAYCAEVGPSTPHAALPEGSTRRSICRPRSSA